MRLPRRSTGPALLLLAALAACDARAPQPTAPPGAAVRAAGQPAPLLGMADAAVPGRYVVVLRDGGDASPAAAVAQQVVAEHGGEVHFAYQAALNGFAATLSPAAVDALRRDPRVEYVAEDAMAYPTQTTQPGATWGLDRIDQRALPLNTTYVYGPTGAGVRVYVMDTGILTSHVEFGTRASVGTDFVGDGRNGQDCNGHGTHVAGTIAGTTYGVAKGAQVISVRVFGCSGGAEYSRIIAAVEWVTTHAQKPAVTNMSLGGPTYAPLNQAVQNSIASGVVYAVAAGNESTDACSRSPASAAAALTVGATDAGDVRSSFSNHGTCVDLWAPGSAITSAWYTSTTATNTISGTSMATPHVAGVAALYLQGNPTGTPAAVSAQVIASTTMGRLTGLLTGSPNRLLYSLLTPEAPGALIAVNPGSLSFTVARPAPSAAGAGAPADGPAQHFVSGGGDGTKAAPADVGTNALTGRLALSNQGTAGLSWTAVSNRPWLSVSPPSGVLAVADSVGITVTVDSATLPVGTHTGSITIVDPAARNSPVTVGVTVVVTSPTLLRVGTPITGLSGAAGSERRFVVQVPAGSPALRIETYGGFGDSDLYVRYGTQPTLTAYDCRGFSGSTTDSCQVQAPLAGTYHVMVHGWSSYSGVTLSATWLSAPPTLPAPPSALRPGANSPTSASLNWTDGSSNETSFQLQRAIRLSDGSWDAYTVIGSPPANATSYTDTGVLPGRAYRWQLRACNGVGCSAWITSGILTMPLPSPPTPPSGATAEAVSGTQVQVRWVDGSRTEQSFSIDRGELNLDGVTWGPWARIDSVGAGRTGYRDTGRVPGRWYRYRIRACNVGGCSSPSATRGVLMPTPPAPPANLAARALSPTEIRLSWTDGSSNETRFVLHRAERAPNGTWGPLVQRAVIPANVRSYGDPASPGVTYRYRLTACNAAGCAPSIGSSNVTTPLN